MDEVWVPSGFNRDGFLASGLKKPIHVMPLGVDVDHFHPEIRGVRNPAGDFVFLANFEWVERKRARHAPEGLQPDLPPERARRSRLQGHQRQQDHERPGADRGPRSVGERRTHRVPPQQGISRTTSSARSTARRTATCRPAAARAGTCRSWRRWRAGSRPSRRTGARTRSSSTRGSRTRCAFAASSPQTRARPTTRAFRWADPDPEHLAHLFRHVCEHREEAAEKGRRAAAEMAARWTWTHAARRIAERLDAIG